MMNLGVQFRVLLVALALGVLVTAWSGCPTRVGTLPEFSPPSWRSRRGVGLSAAEVEQLVTVPLEADCSWCRVVDDIRRSPSWVVLDHHGVKPGTDLYRRARRCRTTAQAHALPSLQAAADAAATSRPVASYDRADSDKRSLIELSELARWTVKPRWKACTASRMWPPSANATDNQVQVDPNACTTRGEPAAGDQHTGNSLWSPADVPGGLLAGTGGFIESQNQRLTVRHVRDRVLADLAKVAVEDKPGSCSRRGHRGGDHHR